MFILTFLDMSEVRVRGAAPDLGWIRARAWAVLLAPRAALGHACARSPRGACLCIVFVFALCGFRACLESRVF